MDGSSPSELPHRYGVYGVLVASGLELAELDTVTRAGAPERPVVRLELADPAAEGGRGAARPRGRLDCADGPVEVLDEETGGLLLVSQRHGVCRVSADGSAVTCAPEDPSRPAWRRHLLDTVLGSAALRRGMTGLHAAAVTIDGRALAITAPTGGGKSTLAAELLRRGAELLTDDLLFVAAGPAGVEAHAGPPFISLAGAETPPRAIGETVAVIGDRRWIRVRRRPPRPSPLSLVVALERDGRGSGAELEAATPDRLLSCALDPGRARGRLLERFDVLSSLGRAVPVLRLRVGARTSPARAAALLESHLGVAAHVG